MTCKTKKERVDSVMKWKRDNPEKVSATNRRYRDKKRGGPPRNSCKVYRSTEDGRLQRTYGIGVKEYILLYTKQSGKCAICGTHQRDVKRMLAVDHCHTTGIIRGLLCGNCNTGIGFFGDDIEELKKAIEYLSKSAGVGQPNLEPMPKFAG